MSCEEKLVKKVKRLLRKAGLPRWLHRFGPKKYEFWHHMLALLVKQVCRLSYRRTSWLLGQLGMKVPTYSALAKMARRLPSSLWRRLLAATNNLSVNVAALDSTMFSRSMPSYHYLARIDCRRPPGKPVKANVLVDTRTKHVITARIRVIPRHDVLDVPAVLRHAALRTLVADKGYDAESVHRLCHSKGITSMIPVRKHVRRGRYRRVMLAKWRTRTYRRREIAEATFSALKRKYGSSVRCRKARSIRAELFVRFIAHNIFMLLKQTFSTKPQLPQDFYSPTSSSSYTDTS
jgi:hypothetical protein